MCLVLGYEDDLPFNSSRRYLLLYCSCGRFGFRTVLTEFLIQAD